jgi:hypothetical protein
MQPVTLDEQLREVEICEDAALKLEDRDLRMMDRLVRAQCKSSAPDIVGDNVVQLHAVGT